MKPNSKNDSICLLNPLNVVVKVVEITPNEIVGFQYNIVKSQDNPDIPENVFQLPANSSDLKYFLVDGVDGALKKWPKKDFSQCVKCVVIPYVDDDYDNVFVAMPLLHHLG